MGCLMLSVFSRTYSRVELRAGPSINLILGPNGTGKSTIVCAICIGLAGKQKILGRANSLKEYIRHGCNAASVEIELYNPDGMNFVIKRSIKGTSKEAGGRDRRDVNTGATSTWYLNGRKAQPGAVSVPFLRSILIFNSIVYHGHWCVTELKWYFRLTNFSIN